MLIQNGIVFTMETEQPAEMDIQIKNGKIAQLASSIEPDEDEDVFNALGLRVYPGFIDAHSHIGIAQEKETLQGDITNEGTNPITPCMRAIDAINPMDSAFHNAIASGITGVMAGPGSANPIGGQFAVIKTAGHWIDRMVVSAPAAMKFALGENPKEVYHGKNQSPETRMATAALIRETLVKAKKYNEAMLQSQQEPEEDEDAPDEPEFDSKLDALMPVIRGELPAHFHAHRADDLFTAVRIAREFGLKYTLVHCTEGHLIAEDLAEIGVDALVGPNLCDRSKPELRELSFENPCVLHRAGVRVGITTDHSVVPIQYLTLCAGLAVKAGMPWEAALEAITINPARILGVDDRVGSIRVGKDADLVLTDGDPLAVMTTVKQVWIDGKTVK